MSGRGILPPGLLEPVEVLWLWTGSPHINGAHHAEPSADSKNWSAPKGGRLSPGRKHHNTQNIKTTNNITVLSTPLLLIKRRFSSLILYNNCMPLQFMPREPEMMT